MFSKVLVAAIVMASVSAHAVESEFFFQSKAGQSDLTANVGFISGALKAKGGTEFKYTGLMNTGVSYEYGINDQFSVEGTLNYQSTEIDTNPKSKTVGMKDPTIGLKGTSSLGASNLRYGLVVGLPVLKATRDGSESSAATGGLRLMPYVGMDTEALNGTLGGRLIYHAKFERTIEVKGQTSDTKYTDGNIVILSGFYETKITDVTLGGGLNFYSQGETKSNNNTVGKSSTSLAMSLYSVLPFGTWSLIPRLEYFFSNSEYDKYDIAIVSLGARFTF